MIIYACNGDLRNVQELDNQPLSTVQIWALVNLNKEKKVMGKKLKNEY